MELSEPQPRMSAAAANCLAVDAVEDARVEPLAVDDDEPNVVADELLATFQPHDESD